MIEERCTDACRHLEAISGPAGIRSVKVTKTCDHPVPRLYADEPFTIKIWHGAATVDSPELVASFTTQCVECRGMFGAWRKSVTCKAIPSDQVVRTWAIALMSALGFDVRPDGVICAWCNTPGSAPTEAIWLRLSEGEPPNPTPGWF